MKRFKDFIPPKEFIAFSNAGGRNGQYDRFDYSENMLWGQGGGRPQKEEYEIEENLNPRVSPKFINSSSKLLYDPEKDSSGLGDEQNSPENIGTPNHHGTDYLQPNYTNEQAKNAKDLLNNVNADDNYHKIIHSYTTNSYNLNNTLIQHHRSGTNPPKIIKSHLDDDENSEIDTELMDHLIKSHKLPRDMTVYSGLHFHPNEHKGKIAHVPSYMSTSLSPHVAKDFGKEWQSTYHDGHETQSIGVKNILRLHLPKGHEHLFTDNGSLFPGQGELILPRGMRYQIGQKPTHIIQGNFGNHFSGYVGNIGDTQYHIYTGRILPRK